MTLVERIAQGVTTVDDAALVERMQHGLVRAEQAIRNLGNGFLSGDARWIAFNEAANLRADIAAADASDGH